jgi:hypothetical protein
MENRRRLKTMEKRRETRASSRNLRKTRQIGPPSVQPAWPTPKDQANPMRRPGRRSHCVRCEPTRLGVRAFALFCFLFVFLFLILFVSFL